MSSKLKETLEVTSIVVLLSILVFIIAVLFALIQAALTTAFGSLAVFCMVMALLVISLYSMIKSSYRCTKKYNLDGKEID